MTGIAAHLPGLVRSPGTPRTQTPQSFSGSFAGLLTPDNATLANKGEVAASAFNAEGLFGARAADFAVERMPPQTQMAFATLTPEEESRSSLPSVVAAEAFAPDQTERPPSFSTANTCVSEPMESVSVESGSTIAITEQIPLSACGVATPGTPKNMATIRQSFVGALRSLSQQLAPQTQAPVQLVVTMQGTLAAVTVRGDVPLAELEARLKRTLAEHDLELGSLRLNGIDRSFATHHLVGGPNGNR